ncbi:hypothetical protein [Pseudomonas sp. NPDC088890]|uniref:hypothetical protein n=1 Tax=Pseudomonas sp. NPDC088890 TaxID=3364458 RepID=UPI00384DA10F
MNIIVGNKNSYCPVSLIVFSGLVFFVGFIIQMVGILSITATNCAALLSLVGLLLFNRGVDARFKKHTLAYLALLASFFIIGLINGSDWLGFLVYLYYFVSPLIVLMSCTLCVNKYYITDFHVYRWAPYYLLLQIFLGGFQRVFPQDIVGFSKTQLSLEDTVSGSFYLASDASLAFFCMLLSIFCLSASRMTLRKLIIVLLGSVVVFMTNSKAMQLLHVMVVISVSACHALSRDSVKKVSVYLCLVLSVICVFLFFHAEILSIYQNFLDMLQYAYDKRLAGSAAHRLAPVGELLFGELSFFGNGFLTYFNPLSKEWLYYSGFSLLYSLYLDCGLVGVLLVNLWFLWFIVKNSKSISVALITYGAFFAFSLFNFTLTDLSVLFSMFLLLLLLRDEECHI